MSGGGRGYPLIAVGNVDAKRPAGAPLLRAPASGGRISPKEGEKNFFGRRIFESEGRFGRIRVSTVVSARFWKKIIFGKKYF